MRKYRVQIFFYLYSTAICVLCVCVGLLAVCKISCETEVPVCKIAGKLTRLPETKVPEQKCRVQNVEVGLEGVVGVLSYLVLTVLVPDLFLIKIIKWIWCIACAFRVPKASVKRNHKSHNHSFG